MDAPKGFAVGGRVAAWFESEDSILLVRPIDIFLAGDVPGPATCVAEALPFGQVGFAAVEGFIGPLPGSPGANGGDSEGEIVGELHELLICVVIELIGFG